MDKIRVCYLHQWVKNVADIAYSLHIEGTDIAEKMIWDDENPDYLFATEAIIAFPEYWQKFKRLIKKAKVRIFCAGEAIEPDLNIFDYAIVFDKKLSDMDRVISMPATTFFAGNMPYGKENTFTIDDAREKLKSRLRFCNFIYSNGVAHPCRDKLFYALSGYKRVESLGPHLNNVNTLIDGGGGADWCELSIRIKSRYKFSISAENAQYEGYTTEKLLTSFQAHSVPIYWGNKFVSEEFNPEAFIDCSKYSSFDEVVDRVREIDNDDEQWMYMVSRPWQTEAQLAASKELHTRYVDFIRHIFSQPIDDAVRRPFGFWAGNYEQWFMNRKFFHGSKITRRFRWLIAGLKRRNIPRTNVDDFFRE